MTGRSCNGTTVSGAGGLYSSALWGRLVLFCSNLGWTNSIGQIQNLSWHSKPPAQIHRAELGSCNNHPILSWTISLKFQMAPTDVHTTATSGFEHFLTAQDPVYATALGELRDGQKRSHWMWFIFPQLRELYQRP
jgi:hypothetical protein